MRATSSTRRALGLIAVSTVGLSTAALGVAGPAAAAEAPDAYTFQVAAGATGETTVPDGYCGITWTVYGGSGGDGSDSPGAGGGVVLTTTDVSAGEEFGIYPGSSGSAAGLGGPGEGGVNGWAGDDADEYDGENGAGTLPDPISGGGGAASVVVSVDGADEYPYIGAFGGDGGDADETFSGSGGGYTFDPEGSADEDAASDGSDGSISGVGVLCDTPDAPTDLAVTDGPGTLGLSFLPVYADDESADADAWEVSLDGGATFEPLSVTDDYDTGGYLAELTDVPVGTYAVQVRGTNEAGNGTATASVETTSYVPIGAPVDLVVTSTASAVTVSWGAPTEEGTYPLAGYLVGYGTGEMGDQVCETAADVRTCSFGLPAFDDYTITVFAVDSEGNTSDPLTAGGVVVSPPAVSDTVPTRDDGDFVSPVGAVTAGQTLVLGGEGFLADSTVALTVYSTPISLGTAVADGTGAFLTEVAVPATLTNGVHTLVATGVDPQGNARNIVVEVTVSGGAAVVAVAGGPSLANTGASVAWPLTGGVLTVLAGAGVLVATRRRTATV